MSAKIKISLDDPEVRTVWNTVLEARREVASWPAWKRGEEATVTTASSTDGTTGTAAPRPGSNAKISFPSSCRPRGEGDLMSAKIKISLDDPEVRTVWNTVLEARREVASWPAWKRGEEAIVITASSTDGTTGTAAPNQCDETAVERCSAGQPTLS